MRSIAALASVLLVLAPINAAAQQAGALIVGATVVDSQGNTVGTITSVKGDVVTVKTDRVEANLAKASFAQSNGKAYLGMTRAELNAAVEKDKLAAEASLSVGKPVKGAQGVEVGTIEAIDSEFVTLKLSSGKSVRVPRSGIAGSANGAFIGITAAAVEAQAGGS